MPEAGADLVERVISYGVVGIEDLAAVAGIICLSGNEYHRR